VVSIGKIHDSRRFSRGYSESYGQLIDAQTIGACFHKQSLRALGDGFGDWRRVLSSTNRIWIEYPSPADCLLGRRKSKYKSIT
jgi:hypothetical protein